MYSFDPFMNSVLVKGVDESAPDKPDIGTVFIRGSSILHFVGEFRFFVIHLCLQHATCPEKMFLFIYVFTVFCFPPFASIALEYVIEKIPMRTR